ncbi:[4Fe-4S] proteins maturation [Malassezia japonica]|uniref:[4Fe-4S] proteins maturation n=1 Tax=Malassezia japonica TaxID=223818 RepID=A0AAF0F7D2_9BASI|nr:[4Fe-4S] proteins maturation [Malassezia japonica]WFD41359.1 [4Fe-4S] proteins maturation [Malassezia japonica]
MSMLQRGLRGALRSVPSASTARVGGLSMQSSISYVPRNLGRPALHLPVPPRASVRLASTLVAKPEHPEDETVMEGDTPLVHLTERAVQKIRSVAEADSDPNVGLRIIVEPGGCHGYMYKLEITSGTEEDDFVFDDGGARIIVDSFSLGLVKGSTIDYVTELIGSQFAIKDNPQAKGSGCGCGVSWEPVL